MWDYLYRLATDKQRTVLANALKVFLFLFSLIYGLTVRFLAFFYGLKPYQLDCQVISVGNITLGGTGKTSLVEYIAHYLKIKGYKVAILSRGYKRPKAECRNPKDEYETMGDEPYMLKMKLKGIPVLVNPDRIHSAKLAIRDYAVDTVILDDGFQQWRIKKDLEIVTIDVTNPFGNWQLIPRGILREPLSCLKRTDVFVLTKANLNPDFGEIKDFLSSINSQSLIIESVHEPKGFYKIDNRNELIKIDALKEKNVTLISGIADPDSFENLIVSLGIKVGLSFRFPDHYAYVQNDLEKISEESQKKNIDTIITTEKDAVRLTPYLLPATYYLLNILVLSIELKVTKDEERFHNRLLRLYSR